MSVHFPPDDYIAAGVVAFAAYYIGILSYKFYQGRKEGVTIGKLPYQLSAFTIVQGNKTLKQVKEVSPHVSAVVYVTPGNSILYAIFTAVCSCIAFLLIFMRFTSV